MSSALIDTPLLLDYLHGDKRAQRALAAYAHRSLSVVTWLELMSQCPTELLEPTRGFLRTFERLSVSESIADEAQRLMRAKPGLPLPRALTWATAAVNQLVFLTIDPTHVDKSDRQVLLPYRLNSAGSANAKAGTKAMATVPMKMASAAGKTAAPT
jgi:predicted nucleic acid-binding protein